MDARSVRRRIVAARAVRPSRERDRRRGRGAALDPLDYAALHRWSVDDLGRFWEPCADFAEIRFHDRAEVALAEEVMPHERWFEGASREALADPGAFEAFHAEARAALAP
ncbi:hypothetical protein B7R54_01065 [Subtercola boreus]|uniref:Acetyl-coenzyme A synthetase N-terminal domain-containing protein n=1 Tax=Subtercola boreus TaxID=120213 RepID=A0A3E0VF13_9MICO|nr:acetyl-coenzyme A synthetase N-terminal domain-containing protein [Subtercola boreus]RFA07960.1 hypothetical protein B7R54_01065 [Subtercola boreus]